MRWIGVAARNRAFSQLPSSGAEARASESSSTTTEATETETTTDADTTDATDETTTDTTTDTTESSRHGRDGRPDAGVRRSGRRQQQVRSGGLAGTVREQATAPEATADCVRGAGGPGAGRVEGRLPGARGRVHLLCRRAEGPDLKPGETPNAAQIGKLAAGSRAFSAARGRQGVGHIAAWVTKNCSTTG